MKSYKEFINEAYFKQVEDLNKLIDRFEKQIAKKIDSGEITTIGGIMAEFKGLTKE